MTKYTKSFCTGGVILHDNIATPPATASVSTNDTIQNIVLMSRRRFHKKTHYRPDTVNYRAICFSLIYHYINHFAIYQRLYSINQIFALNRTYADGTFTLKTCIKIMLVIKRAWFNRLIISACQYVYTRLRKFYSLWARYIDNIKHQKLATWKSRTITFPNIFSASSSRTAMPDYVPIRVRLAIPLVSLLRRNIVSLYRDTRTVIPKTDAGEKYVRIHLVHTSIW